MNIVSFNLNYITFYWIALRVIILDKPRGNEKKKEENWPLKVVLCCHLAGKGCEKKCVNQLMLQ